MADIDLMIFSGRIGKIEKRETKTGKFLHRISVAVSKYDSQAKEEKTIWKAVQIWESKYVDQYAEKGQKVLIHGETREEEWTNKDGQKVKNQYCLVTKNGKIELFFNGKGNGGQSNYQKKSHPNTYNKKEEDVLEDDIPF